MASELVWPHYFAPSGLVGKAGTGFPGPRPFGLGFVRSPLWGSKWHGRARTPGVQQKTWDMLCLGARVAGPLTRSQREPRGRSPLTSPPQQFMRALHNIRRGESEFLRQHFERSRGSKTAQADHVTLCSHVAFPAEGRAGLNGQPRRHLGRQNFVAIRLAAVFQTGPRKACSPAVQQRPPPSASRRPRGAGATSEPVAIRMSLRRLSLRVGQHVSALGQSFRRAILGAIDDGQSLAGQAQRHGAVADARCATRQATAVSLASAGRIRLQVRE